MATKYESVVTIEATFPELKGGAAHQQGRGKGTNTRTALKQAVVSLLKQPKLKRKHFTMFTATVSIGRIKKQEDGIALAGVDTPTDRDRL